MKPSKECGALFDKFSSQQSGHLAISTWVGIQFWADVGSKGLAISHYQLAVEVDWVTLRNLLTEQKNWQTVK